MARNGNTYEAFIQGSVATETITIADPIVDIFPGRPSNLTNFLEKYIKARSKSHSHLINYWHRLKEIPQFNTEAAGLVLCVNIEGMIKKLFLKQQILR